jgi:hypothetical protein
LSFCLGIQEPRDIDIFRIIPLETFRRKIITIGIDLQIRENSCSVADCRIIEMTAKRLVQWLLAIDVNAVRVKIKLNIRFPKTFSEAKSDVVVRIEVLVQR